MGLVGKADEAFFSGKAMSHQTESMMAPKPLIGQTLDAVEHAIDKIMAPELQSADARFVADMAGRLLQWLKIQLREGPDLRKKHLDALGTITREASAHLGTVPDSTDGGMPAELVRHFCATNDPQSLALIERLIDVETQYIQGQDPEAGCNISENYRGGLRTHPKEAEDAHAVTTERLTAYMRRRFAGSTLEATDVRRLAGGLGKDTVLFNITGNGPVTGPAVMRKDLPISPIDATALDECRLLEALTARNIPVPRLLWAESDASWFGGAFIVVRHMPGTIDTSTWIEQPEQSRGFARTLARTMAHIHAVSAADLDILDAPRTAAEGTRAYLLRTRDLYRRKSLDANPRLEALFAWLFDNIPDGDRPSRLVHGDIGFHNLLIDNGEVTAILDWENYHFGDPAEDVAYVRQFVERALPWQEFLDMYHEEGGPEYTEAHDRFFTLWGNARNGVGCLGAEYAYRRLSPPSIKYGTVGLIYGPRWEIEALRQMQELLVGSSSDETRPSRQSRLTREDES